MYFSIWQLFPVGFTEVPVVWKAAPQQREVIVFQGKCLTGVCYNPSQHKVLLFCFNLWMYKVKCWPECHDKALCL